MPSVTGSKMRNSSALVLLTALLLALVSTPATSGTPAAVAQTPARKLVELEGHYRYRDGLTLFIVANVIYALQAARVPSDVLIKVQPEEALGIGQREGYRKLRNQEPSIKWIMPVSIDSALMERERFSLELHDQTLQVVRTSDPGLIDSFGQRRWRGHILEGGKIDELSSVGLSLTKDGEIYGSVRSLEWHYEVLSEKAGSAVIVAHRTSEMDADTSGDVPPTPRWPSMDP